MTFNQVVRGSNPRTLTLDKQYCLSILLSEALQNKAGLMYADVAELADAPDLGSGVHDVQVRFLSSAVEKARNSGLFYFVFYSISYIFPFV